MLFRIYQKLTQLERPKEGTFFADKTEFPWLRVAIDQQGHPLFFIEPKIGKELPPALPVSENLELKFRHSGMVKAPSGDTYEMLDVAIISFHSLDQELINLFFEIFEVFLSSLSEVPSEYEISQRCANYLEMFRLAKSPSLTASLGLWGELFFILQYENPDKACNAWHQKHSENYDFVFPGIFHEIKTTKKQKRKHTLKLSQVEKSGGREGFITSIMTKESAEGLSCLELARQILQKVQQQSSSDKLLKVVAQLGYAEENLNAQSFCVETAKTTIAHFNVTDLPRPDTGENRDISNVVFDLNFENLPFSDYYPQARGD